MLEIALVGIQFWIYVVIAITFAEKLKFNFICYNYVTHFQQVFNYSFLVTSLCCNVYGMVFAS